VIRLILFLGLMYLLYVVLTKPFHELFGGSRPKFQKSPKDSQKDQKTSKKPQHDAEEMVACALCGTFISRREGETRDGKFVCRPSCHVV
jgi:hypothetical protein